MTELTLRSNITDRLGFLSQIIDSIGTSLVGALCHTICVGGLIPSREYINFLIFNSLLILIIFPSFGLYFSWRGRNKWKRILSCVNAWSLTLVLLVLLTFILKTSASFSRVWFFLWWLSGLSFLLIYRKLLDIILIKLRLRGLNHKRVVIYGAGKTGSRITSKLKAHPEIGFDIICFIDDSTEKQGTLIEGVPVLDSSQLILKSKSANEIWIALPFNAQDKIENILFETRHQTVVIKIIPDIFGFRLLNHSISEIAGFPLIDINGSPLSSKHLLLKRTEDVLLSLIILIVISPLMLLVAIAIKLTSRGPIIYKQKRNGWDGRTINVYKFRSMLYKKNDVFVRASQLDVRITPIGRFLRGNSIDELPQFLNVLQGRMSIVGPRPHAVSMNEEYKDKVNQYMQRHKVKPGITGWAQVNGFRGETDTLDKMERRVQCDLYYIQNWSLLLDLKIIIMTLFNGTLRKNAF